LDFFSQNRRYIAKLLVTLRIIFAELFAVYFWYIGARSIDSKKA